MNLDVTAEPSLGDVLGVRDWADALCVQIMCLLSEFSTQPAPAIREIGARLEGVDVTALTLSGLN